MSSTAQNGFNSVKNVCINSIFSKAQHFVHFGSFDLVQISPVCGPNTYQIIWKDFRPPVSAFATIGKFHFFMLSLLTLIFPQFYYSLLLVLLKIFIVIFSVLSFIIPSAASFWAIFQSWKNIMIKEKSTEMLFSTGKTLLYYTRCDILAKFMTNGLGAGVWYGSTRTRTRAQNTRIPQNPSKWYFEYTKAEMGNKNQPKQQN